jgi:hypothetical protein
MREVFHGCVSMALLALLATPAFAGNKKVDGLIFRPGQASPNCVSGSFFVLQEPDAFFKKLTKTETHGIEQFRRGNEVVEKFPDELLVTVQFSQNAAPSLCPMSSGLDPKTIKFRAEWRDGSSTVVAKGIVLRAELLDQGPWCEDKCGAVWKYLLKIDSEGVPLRDVLLITVDAKDGTQLAQYVGKLGSSTEVPSFVLLP